MHTSLRNDCEHTEQTRGIAELWNEYDWSSLSRALVPDLGLRDQQRLLNVSYASLLIVHLKSHTLYIVHGSIFSHFTAKSLTYLLTCISCQTHNGSSNNCFTQMAAFI